MARNSNRFVFFHVNKLNGLFGVDLLVDDDRTYFSILLKFHY